jgi:hypothetical protein
MSKKIAFRRPAGGDADAWVASGAEVQQPATVTASQTAMKRLTIDIPADLHRRVKRECADRGVKMADVVRDLLLAEFPE